MKPIDQIERSPISFSPPPLSEGQVDEFRKATHTTFSKRIPPTFPTSFRKAEFEFLDRAEVDMRMLLHIEQEYEYHQQLITGEQLTVTTKIEEMRERRGMCFFTLVTDIASKGIHKVTSTTQFVVRK